MARVTVEDCIEKTEGVFSLIKLASQRARRIANGAQTLLENEENDKPTVLALREICLLYTSPSPRDRTRSRMPSSA